MSVVIHKIADSAIVETDVPEILEELIWLEPWIMRDISQDILFLKTAGEKRPKKHLQIGIAVKSLAGSRRVIELLTRTEWTEHYSITMQ